MMRRVLSGIRGTGALHLGHHHFALKNWVKLQDEFDCCYFVADWHARTTHDQEATLFIQRRLPEHAELFTLLAMGTPLAWLERVPSYKDQIEQLTTQQRSSATAQQRSKTATVGGLELQAAGDRLDHRRAATVARVRGRLSEQPETVAVDR